MYRPMVHHQFQTSSSLINFNTAVFWCCLYLPHAVLSIQYARSGSKGRVLGSRSFSTGWKTRSKRTRHVRGVDGAGGIGKQLHRGKGWKGVVGKYDVQTFGVWLGRQGKNMSSTCIQNTFRCTLPGLLNPTSFQKQKPVEGKQKGVLCRPTQGRQTTN